MRAAVVDRLGEPPDLREEPEPVRRQGDAVVEILAVPLNPIDVNVGAGRFYGGHPELPFIPGCEAVARVVEGDRVEAGRLVWVHGDGFGVSRDGALAERAVAPESALTEIPPDADPVVAGALGIAGLAGWVPLAWRAPVRKGDVVLVLGATGTVGLVAVQAARILGAGRVVAAGRRAEALERARAAGADAAIALDQPDDLAAAFRDACGGRGPDLVVDPLWGEPLAAALEAAAPGARAVNIGQSAGPTATIASAAVRGKQLELYGYSNFAVPKDVLAREYRRLVDHGSRGDVRVEIERVPLEDVADAWRRQAQGAGRKLVVMP